jgi:nucleoid-associated protein YgaU
MTQNEPSMQATHQIMDIREMEIPAASPHETSPHLVAWSPQSQVQSSAPIAQPIPVQQPVVAPAPVSFHDVADNSVVSEGIVSPSQHIAAMPMVSPDTPTRFISHEMPPTGTSATSAPAYSMQSTSFQNSQNVTQQTMLQTSAATAQIAPYGQNSVYIVQPGDSIYKIAKQELGSVRRYREIYELNRDRLPFNHDTLTAGLELLLPTGRQ